MPSFRRVASAIDRIVIVCHVNVTVLGRMNLLRVHDKAIHPIVLRKDSFE
jgi:hypothetical protein